MTSPEESAYPKALPAPTSATTLIGKKLIDQVVKGSRLSPRKRLILPLHKDNEAPLHRMLNALQPNSYLQPHRHMHPPKPESVIVLQGALLCFLFNDRGEVEEVHFLAAGSENFGIDNEPGRFHTFLATEPDTVILEVKPGPYHQSSEKDFASWAPREGATEANNYMEYLYNFI